MTPETADLVDIRREGRVLVITMTRDAKRNAVDRVMASAIDAALNELDDDPELWAGVLTGSSTFFCAGSDLTANGDYVTERGGEYGIIRRKRSKPLIAAVEGPALGGGLEIILACDLVSCVDSGTVRASGSTDRCYSDLRRTFSPTAIFSTKPGSGTHSYWFAHYRRPGLRSGIRQRTN